MAANVCTNACCMIVCVYRYACLLSVMYERRNEIQVNILCDHTFAGCAAYTHIHPPFPNHTTKAS